MSTVKAEVTFMVYGQNGSGKIEKRTLELSHQDFIAFLKKKSKAALWD